MTHCHEMHEGQILFCADCGLELRVVKECTECGTEEECRCEQPCVFECCGQPLQLREG